MTQGFMIISVGNKDDMNCNDRNEVPFGNFSLAPCSTLYGNENVFTEKEADEYVD